VQQSQAQRRFGIFGLVDFDEQIERLFRIIFGFSLPDVVVSTAA
jgi:hypothetical protein